MNRFGELLREARKQAKLTQQELAEKVGVDDSYISKIETGTFQPPSREVVVALADALGISKKAERLSFLLAAGTVSNEDLEGIALVEMAEESDNTAIDLVAGKMPREVANKWDATDLDQPPTVPQNKQRILAGGVNPAVNISSELIGTAGEYIENLIVEANLSNEEEDKVITALIEITKQLLTLVDAQRIK
jgi:transcriptional regulator with XRE-family HTH domain